MIKKLNPLHGLTKEQIYIPLLVVAITTMLLAVVIIIWNCTCGE